MKPEDFAAGVNQLHPLLNPDKRSQYRAKEIVRRLKDSTPFLVDDPSTSAVASHWRFSGYFKIQILKLYGQSKMIYSDSMRIAFRWCEQTQTQEPLRRWNSWKSANWWRCFWWNSKNHTWLARNFWKQQWNCFRKLSGSCSRYMTQMMFLSGFPCKKWGLSELK